MRVVLLGPPGAGKGTQAEKLAEKLGIPHISTGELFRSNIQEGTKLGVEAKRYLDAGDLVPSSLTNELVDDRKILKVRRYRDGVTRDDRFFHVIAVS